MNKNNWLAILLVFALITVVRIIGIENIPFPIIVVVLILSMIVAVLSILRYKGSKRERIFLVVMTIIVALLLCLIIIAVAIENSYPAFSARYKPAIIAIMGMLFVSLIVAVFANAIYKYKKAKNKKVQT